MVSCSSGHGFIGNLLNPAKQKKFQIQLACELKKPLFLHEREAHADMVRLLELYRERGSLPLCVIHCFTGNKEQARKYLSMGCYIGLTGGI